MLIDNHPFIFGYLLGSLLVVILILFKITLFWLIDWIIKANILQKNISKLMPPDEKTFWAKAGVFIGVLIFEALLSWINVAVVLWQIATGILRVARDLLQPAPEVIKVLRFPLRNNPDMPRESVWAYLQALSVKAGEKQPTQEAIISSLNEIAEMYPTFNCITALKQLESLGAVSPDVTSASLEAMGK